MCGFGRFSLTTCFASRSYRTRFDARADVFDHIERFYSAVRRHSTIGHISPLEFEEKVELA
jgi:putative transposase